MDNDTPIKSLIINGVEYAKYSIGLGDSNKVLFIKIIKQIITGDEGESEEYCCELIGLIENIKFFAMGFLNV